MEHKKAHVPVVFPLRVYQTFWDIIKIDLMTMFSNLQCGELPIFKLKFGMITLMSKKEDSSIIEKYRPICLLCMSFKIFT